jgi:PKHD-type hydroxylase
MPKLDDSYSCTMNWSHIFPKALSEDDCAKVLERAFQYPSQAGTVGYGGETHGVDERIRKSTIRWLQREDPYLGWLYLRIEHLVLKSNRESFGFDLSGTCGGFSEIQFTEYHAEGEQKYDWHEDNNWKGSGGFDRKLSVVIQLSHPTSYEGGRLELHNDPLGEKDFRGMGDVILFPSFNRHRVTPVTRGVRYSLVTWVCGPRLR